MIVHARGVSYPQVMSHLKQVDGGFFDNADEQKNLYKLRPITNAVTVSNIASFETGSLPSEHGIVGHNFGNYSDEKIRPVSGFSVRFENETFWEKADKSGKKVLKLGALVLHGKYESHENVDCVAQGTQTGNAQIITLIPTEKNEQYTKYKIHPPGNPLLLKDSTNVTFYMSHASNSIFLDSDYIEGNGSLGELIQNEWLRIKEESINEITSTFKIKWEAKSNDTLTLYKRASFINRGYPQEFLKQVDANAGPATGWPNIPFYSTNQISVETIVEEIFDEMDYVMKTFEEATKKKEYDLIYIDYPIMDRFGHGLMGTDPSIFKSMFSQMNIDFSHLEQFCLENNYELIITSGHGFSPIHTSIDLNQFLLQNGIETKTQNVGWEAVGIPGKVSAHIYINPRLSPNERKVLMNKISGRLRGLIDENTKDSVVEQIVRRSELHQIGLDHSNAGELFVLLKPGYVFSNSTQPSIFEFPIFKGDHGYSLKHEDSYGFVYSNKKCDPCKTTHIANLVLETLKVK